MLIQDLPTKWVLVRRRDGKLFYQRYHYRPELIPDAEFSKAVEQVLETSTILMDAYGDVSFIVGNEWMTVEEVHRRDIPPRVVVPEAMNDWEQAKARALQAGSNWVFPMQLHLTDEFMQKIAQSTHASGESPSVKNLALLYTYSSSEEALQFLRRLGEDTLRKQEPMRDSVREWLGINYRLTHILLMESNYYNYAVAASRVYSRFYGRAYIKSDYRLLWRHVREWLPLLVDVNARQMAWQGAEAHRRGIPAGAWVNQGEDYPENAYERKLVGSNSNEILSSPPVDARIRHYLSGDALQYYKQVYDAMREANPYIFREGVSHYQRFLAALGS